MILHLYMYECVHSPVYKVDYLPLGQFFGLTHIFPFLNTVPFGQAQPLVHVTAHGTSVSKFSQVTGQGVQSSGTPWKNLWPLMGQAA